MSASRNSGAADRVPPVESCSLPPILGEQLREAEVRFGPIGVAGVYGVGDAIAPRDPTQPLASERIGWVVDRGRELHELPELPASVTTLDELLLVVPRDTELRFEPELGFHIYGADLCWQGASRLAPGVSC